jgi:lipoprotein-releasing system ATP-binding protein
MADPLLRLEDVTKDYGERVITRVLRGISFGVDEGEFTALVGPSGSGKSTLLHLLGLLDRPTGGRILLRGCDTGTLGSRALGRFRGRTIGFVFQFHHLLPAFSALENVMMPLLADRGRPDEEMAGRSAHLLERVGLSDRAHFRVTDLSGGQQQRVAVARSLAMNPALILADEPTGNLDTRSGDQVFDLLRQFNREQGTAFIIELVDGRITSDRLRDVPTGESGTASGPATT